MYDIRRCCRYGDGENVLVVWVDPTANEGWWYEGGGIYRHVWLEYAAPLHVSPHGVFTTTTVQPPITAAGTSAAAAEVRIVTNLTNIGCALCVGCTRPLCHRSNPPPPPTVEP